MKYQSVGKWFRLRTAFYSMLAAALLIPFAWAAGPAVAGAPPAPAETGLLAPPGGLAVRESDSKITLIWNAVRGAAQFKVYRSTTEGLGYTLLTRITANIFQRTYSIEDPGLTNQTPYYYVVTTIDSNGSESGSSNEIAAMPHLIIDWVGTITPEIISDYALGSPDPVIITGKVHIPHHTGLEGPAPGVIGQLGYGPEGTAPVTWTHWFDAAYIGHATDETPIENDYFSAAFRPEAPGDYETIYRFSTTGGRDWVYGGFALIDPAVPAGSDVRIGKLHAAPSSDTTAPAAPGSPSLTGTSATSITLTWGASTDDVALYRYDILRAERSGGPYEMVGSVDAGANPLEYQDSGLVAGTSYYYVIQAVDTSFNRSSYSAELAAETDQSLVPMTIRVVVPEFTPGTSVFINQTVNADGTLGGKSWNALKMTPDAAPHTYKVDLTLREGIRFAFYFSRGSQVTVQTNADGNLAAPAPDFTVTAGMPVVLRRLMNWDDPLIIANWPDASEAEMISPVFITWNQAMPASTQFTVTDITSGKPVVFPGKFYTDPASRSTYFQPDSSFTAGYSYAVSVSGQPDLNGLAQVVPLKFSFRALLYHTYLTAVRR